MLVEYLRSEFANRTKRNATYSLRAYARALKVDSATLSAILSGKRKLTLKSAKHLLDGLAVDAATYESLMLGFISPSRLASGSATSYQLLDADVLALVAGWEHYGILSLLEIPSQKTTPRELAKRLGIGVGEAMAAQDRLARLGLIKIVRGRWQPTRINLTTTTDVPSAALRTAHRQYIARAMESLDRDDLDLRDITGMTMAISRKNIPAAKAMIRDFRRKLCVLLESGEREEVFRLNVQLFPLTVIRK